MKIISIELTDAEYTILAKLAVPDSDGKLEMRRVDRSMSEWPTCEKLYYSDQIARVMLSPAGQFLMKYGVLK